jgi:hypothetical protein
MVLPEQGYASPASGRTTPHSGKRCQNLPPPRWHRHYCRPFANVDQFVEQRRATRHDRARVSDLRSATSSGPRRDTQDNCVIPAHAPSEIEKSLPVRGLRGSEKRTCDPLDSLPELIEFAGSTPYAVARFHSWLPAGVPVPRPAVGVSSRSMSKRQPSSPPPADQPSEEYLRFERMTSALFRVDKRDVPKHEPKKRQPASREDLDANQEHG